MARIPVRRDRYSLRDIHQEIDLYDRKLAYLDQCVDFATPADREEAENRLIAKRAPLEKAALELVASGVEYDEKDLPRSLRITSKKKDAIGRHLTLVKNS